MAHRAPGRTDLPRPMNATRPCSLDEPATMMQSMPFRSRGWSAAFLALALAVPLSLRTLDLDG